MQSNRIIIIEPLFLIANGLKAMLESIMHMVSINCYPSIEALKEEGSDIPDHCHFFVNESIFEDNREFFCGEGRVVIVLTSGNSHNAESDNTIGANSSFLRYLNISGDEKEIVRSLIAIHGEGHRHGHPKATNDNAIDRLSQREKEVLIQIASGKSNKEIAEILHISLPTVVTHRTNISNKLGIKSIASLAIFAAANGLITPA